MLSNKQAQQMNHILADHFGIPYFNHSIHIRFISFSSHIIASFTRAVAVFVRIMKKDFLIL